MTRPTENAEILLVSPSEILLDPNSFRLIEDPLWESVPDAEIADPGVQGRTYESILTDPRHGLRDLRASIDEYGWLEIEPLWVRKLPDGRLVVLDGNRRVVAWRMVFEPPGRQVRLFAPSPAPAMIAVHATTQPASRESSLSLGLRHLLSPRPWPTLGAVIWRELHRREYGEWPEGAPIRRPRRWRPDIEVLALDLARMFARERGSAGNRTDVYYLLLEALSTSRIREWLDLEAGGSRLSRFFAWLVPQDDPRAPSDPNESGAPFRPRAPVSAVDVHRLASVLDQPEVLARLDAGERLGDILGSAPAMMDEPESYLHPWVSVQVSRKAPIDSTRAQSALGMLRETLLRANEQPVESGTDHPWPLIDAEAPLFVRSLALHQFRGLSGTTLSDLSRINLFVGVNNAGKTSVLEALYILAHLSDPRGVLDTLRIRTRQDPERQPAWLSELVSTLAIELDAVDAHNRRLAVRMIRRAPPEGTDLSRHIPGMRIEADVGGIRHATDTDLFSHRPRRTVQVEGKTVWLSSAVLHSPYARLDRAAVVHGYRESVERESLSTILAAIQEAVDPGIEDIRLVSENGRFIVEHMNRPPMDLASYGEGLQRVFEIGLLFAAHRGGLVLIDELETAIHPGAMLRFTHMIQHLAVTFETQVFISTHSKETVDAFLLNGFRTSDIAAYILRRSDSEQGRVQRFSGPMLKRAIEVGDVDLRRL